MIYRRNKVELVYFVSLYFPSIYIYISQFIRPRQKLKLFCSVAAVDVDFSLLYFNPSTNITLPDFSSHLYFPSSSCCFVVYYNCYYTTICWVLSLLTRSTLFYPLLFSPFSPKKSNLIY